MAILVTGASGFVGRVLIPKLLAKGNEVIALARDVDKAKSLLPKEVRVVQGDILLPECGVKEELPEISAVYHLAGIHSLRPEDKDRAIWQTNVEGTRNVLWFCERHQISRLFFTSTAYTWPVNPYGLSKIKNEEDIKDFAEKRGLKVAIFKPSIIMGTAYPGHFSQFVSLLIKIHQRAELIRRKIEGSLRLPVIEPVFRVRGNPAGRLNLVTVDAVAEAMASIDKEGTFWLTNPNPPTLEQLVKWVGEFIMVDFRIMPEFKPTPIEAQFMKMASAFTPYLQGDDFPSDLGSVPITREFIQETIKRTLQS
jgi:nucleoside-diphosphate-sugar epimerase